jgi:hypothetical protein
MASRNLCAMFLGIFWTPIALWAATPGEMFVTRIHMDLVSRTPKASELQPFALQIDMNQLSRTTYVTKLLAKLEFAAAVKKLQASAYGVSISGSSASAESEIAEVFSNWRGYGAVWAGAVYQAVFHRPLTKAEAAYYNSLLPPPGTGADATLDPVAEASVTLKHKLAIALRILALPEALAEQIKVLYIRLLDRPADPAGLKWYTDLYTKKVTFETVVTMMAGTDEYWALR